MVTQLHSTDCTDRQCVQSAAFQGFFCKRPCLPPCESPPACLLSAVVRSWSLLLHTTACVASVCCLVRASTALECPSRYGDLTQQGCSGSRGAKQSASVECVLGVLFCWHWTSCAVCQGFDYIKVWYLYAAVVLRQQGGRRWGKMCVHVCFCVGYRQGVRWGEVCRVGGGGGITSRLDCVSESATIGLQQSSCDGKLVGYV